VITVLASVRGDIVVYGLGRVLDRGVLDRAWHFNG